MAKESIGMHCMAVERVTLDTNVLIYAIDKDADPKQERAIDLIENCALSNDCVLTIQALAEFSLLPRAKLKYQLPGRSNKSLTGNYCFRPSCLNPFE